jgi:CBS domain-containing protein
VRSPSASTARPQSLIVELTEEGLVRDLSAMRADLEPLLTRGIKLAVDDMGAGYSNLRQVTALGPSLVKLDRTLVHGIDSAPAQFALIDALIGYAQRTGAQIVAEGIETRAELEVLRSLGVTFGQGYLLAAPGSPWPEVHLEPAKAIAGHGRVEGSRPVMIDVDVTSDEARRRFAAQPELESFAIVDDEIRPLGLITRHRLLTMLGHRFGYALWGDKSIMHIADSDRLRVPADTPIDEIARRSLARPLDRRQAGRSPQPRQGAARSTPAPQSRTDDPDEVYTSFDQVSDISLASRPGMRPKWRMLAVPTRQPADIAVAATMRSCAPTSTPDEARPAQSRAWTRATSRSKESTGNASSTAATNASRRARCSSVAL